MPTDAYIYSAIRTPRGKGRTIGALHNVPPVALLTTLLHTLQQRYSLGAQPIDDLIIGCVTPIGEQGANLGRAAVLAANWHVDTPAMQLNRFCASGLEAVNLAAMKVRSGWAECVLAGGVESMSRVPLGSDGGALMDAPQISAQIGFVPQGISADLIATLEGFSRTELDEYALYSQQRAATAIHQGYFKSIVPVTATAIGGDEKTMLLAQDEHPRPESTMATLATLPPAFQAMGEARFDAIALGKYPQLQQIDHLHTAGNSSGIVDGAALVVVGSKTIGDRLGIQPRARVIGAALVGTEPTIMLTGPAPASRKALQQAGMALRDIDLVEVNEAFAAVVLKFMRDMAVDEIDRINVNGGAIALGHPLGATGAMLLGTALDELERRDQTTALITLCAGGGMGIATIIERV